MVHVAKTKPGCINVDRIDDEEWPYYWHAFVGDVRVNGGLAKDYAGATQSARNAIWKYRRELWIGSHIWDEETARWYNKETGAVVVD